MGNLGGGEVLVILLVALIVLGPTKLPTAIREVGRFLGEIRRIGASLQNEMREAAAPLAEPLRDTKETLTVAERQLRDALEPQRNSPSAAGGAAKPEPSAGGEHGPGD